MFALLNPYQIGVKVKRNTAILQLTPPSMQTCLHTNTVCVCVHHHKWAQHSSTHTRVSQGFSNWTPVITLDTTEIKLTISWCTPPSVPGKKPRTEIWMHSCPHVAGASTPRPCFSGDGLLLYPALRFRLRAAFARFPRDVYRNPSGRIVNVSMEERFLKKVKRQLHALLEMSNSRLMRPNARTPNLCSGGRGMIWGRA